MIIGVFGISGVGKTTFTKLIKNRLPNILRYSASELIKNLDGEVNYERLYGDVVFDNQKKLSIAIENILNEHVCKNVFIELHNIIETNNGVIYVEENILRGLHLDKVFFIEKDPRVIIENRLRDTKIRGCLSVSDIDKLQSQALEYFMKVYKDFDKQVIAGSNDDVANITKFLS